MLSPSAGSSFPTSSLIGIISFTTSGFCCPSLHWASAGADDEGTGTVPAVPQTYLSVICLISSFATFALRSSSRVPSARSLPRLPTSSPPLPPPLCALQQQQLQSFPGCNRFLCQPTHFSSSLFFKFQSLLLLLRLPLRLRLCRFLLLSLFHCLLLISLCLLPSVAKSGPALDPQDGLRTLMDDPHKCHHSRLINKGHNVLWQITDLCVIAVATSLETPLDA